MRFVVNLFLVLGFVFVTNAVVAAAPLEYGSFKKRLSEIQTQAEEYETFLSGEEVDGQDLYNMRQDIKSLIADLKTVQEGIAPQIEAVQADLDDLGPVPEPAAEGEAAPAEPPNIKKLRQDLNEEMLRLQGISEQAEVLTSKSRRLLDRLASLRRGQFIGQILENNTSPFSPDLWVEGAENFKATTARINEIWNETLTAKAEGGSLKRLWLSLAGVLLVTFILMSVACRVVCRYVTKPNLDSDKTKRRDKFSYAGFKTLAVFVTGAIGIASLYFALKENDIITAQNEGAFKALALLLVFLLFAVTKSFALLKVRAIRAPLIFLSIISAIIFVADASLSQLGHVLNIPLEMVVTQSYVAAGLFGIWSVFFALQNIKGVNGDAMSFKRRLLLWVPLIIGVFILSACALGYVSLAHYVFTRLVLIGNLIAAVLLIRAMLHAGVRKLDAYMSSDAAEDSAAETIEENLMLFWLGLFLDLTLIGASMPFVAAIFGMDWVAIQAALINALAGFQIGNITISVTNIAVAIGLFIALIFGTRFIQNILRNKILAKTRLAEDVRLSLVQIFGYIGLTFAFMMAIVAVGFDLTNLAIIAGALSVGIGFGLQSIVSNFVSGLILLLERPIKVGDWVIVNSGEGFVKKISVRATEIETFERTSIIVPNSELISSSVKNWTHKDKIGRHTVSVGVSYDSDPQTVHDLLMKIAKDHDSILNSPAPTVLFKDFGDSALIFDLRIFLKNIDSVFKVATDVRLKIWYALKEADIEIPFPQRDLHIRSSELLEVETKAAAKKKAAPKKATKKSTAKKSSKSK